MTNQLRKKRAYYFIQNFILFYSIDINIYPKYWIRNDTDFESVSGYFETLPFKAGLLNVKAESIEYNFVI